MLTGLPQFYDEDTNEIQRKILSEPLYFPGLDIVSLSAKDILTKLLNRNPEQRLGANGASEIKAHPFFHCIDWHKLLLRKCEPPFKPLKNGPMLHQRRHTPQPQEWEERVAAFRESQKTNTLEKDWTLAKDHKGSSELLDKDFAAEGSALSDEANPTLLSNLPQAAVEEGDNGWVLVWRDTAQAFHFYNRSTNTIQSVNPRLQDPRVEVEAPAPQNLLATRPSGGGYDPAIHGDYHPTVTVHNSPSQSQIQDALEAALTAGYHKRVIAQLLSYSIDLNFEIFRHTQKKMTPLEWATEHENLHLVETFLDNGADANFTFTMFPGRPALRRAVQKGNHRLVSVLVQKTNRLPCTKALGLAVDQQDSTIVKILLANGVHCDFEESDRTAPRHPEDIGQYHHDSSEATEFMPPLVRAVNLGNIDLVRLLLANGADANVEYHDLIRPLRYPRMQEVEPCGRAIQLAMDLGQRETVDLLLDSGADIGLPQPVWRFHECSAVPRETYLKITASLRAAAAAAVA
jgi:serum/glucocorticoid-regulated kinase 2